MSAVVPPSTVIRPVRRSLPLSPLDPSKPSLPAEMVLHVLSFLEDCHPLFSVTDFLHMRANLRHVFANIIEAVPGLFSRILVTPSSSYALKDYHLSLAGSHASHILITVPTTIPYITAHHAHTSVAENLARVVGLVAVHLSSCINLTIQAEEVSLLDVALRSLSRGSPDSLISMQVVLNPAHFGLFYPDCLQAFSFQHEEHDAAPFLPFTRLIIYHGAVSHPRFVHLSCEGNVSHVLLPHGYAISWPDVLRVLSASRRLRVLVLEALEFDLTPRWFLSAPPLHITTLDLDFRGVFGMSTLLVHIPLPSLRTLKVRFSVADDVPCLVQCGAILSNITELVLFGTLPHSYTAAILFRFAFRVEILDLRGGPQFFASFHLASSAMDVAGEDNYNACPALRELRTSGIGLEEVRVLLQDRATVDYDQLDSVVAEEPTGEIRAELITWFHAHFVELSGFILPE
ncbi:hypothetical protein C8J57DRAFT_1481415 [Mycena rebaudengoi]|nr:hypothetical protein C8J57DRAFT_1481415 [Mycena rebaudengoi]